FNGVTAAAVPTPPPGEILYATNGSSISRFSSSVLGSVTTVPITGMQVGETLIGMDLRPATGVIYGVGSTSRVYIINPTTGAATPVGSAGAFAVNGTSFGMDFNGGVDRIRLVSNTEQNLRLNPNDGTLTATDTALSPAGNIVGIAYDRNDATPITPTTLYGIDSAAGTLVTIGSIDGSPNSPNGGQVTTVGSLGLGTNLNESIGFDVSATSGISYATITTGGISRLYTINLATGAATLVSSNGGAIGSGTTPFLSITSSARPTAANVTVSGRVLNFGGAGIRGARITLTDEWGMTRVVMANAFGYYKFEDVAAGHSYTLSPASAKLRFSPRLIAVNDTLTDVNFTPEQ
ncbi:MAG TPA: DUF4394 domain-containing protein, partial [Pyrinomonadaceae bacterium]|nr:DUF4394 domain-containing protein [Pyrinomonadaceae bacterium]